jgi:hypothetical protein
VPAVSRANDTRPMCAAVEAFTYSDDRTKAESSSSEGSGVN